MKAIKNESEVVQMKPNLLLCSYDRPTGMFLLMYVLLDYFQQYPYA